MWTVAVAKSSLRLGRPSSRQTSGESSVLSDPDKHSFYGRARGHVLVKIHSIRLQPQQGAINSQGLNVPDSRQTIISNWLIVSA